MIKTNETATTLHLTLFPPVLQANTTRGNKHYCSPKDGHKDTRNMLSVN